MRRLWSAWLALFLAALPLVSHAVAVNGGPTAVLVTVVDTTTAIPGGSGTFFSWPPDPCISGANVAFRGINDLLR
ncbi:hypothetical protein [Paraburkholderia lacunae]|uniref:Uncharacterized protein n=1 Tax=Paraburkholderia lacunae TaxID=2211104 RepID=A0A370NCX0_9BURK|nr:hypothetical protein [Paraburkholderia lacunae]RDK03423.1 hypothetical protein DLM46_07800 [Paraburkholderia lacunae]